MSNSEDADYIMVCEKAFRKLESENARLLKQVERLREALESSRTMTNELLRTMDEGHWYADDLKALRIQIESALEGEKQG